MTMNGVDLDALMMSLEYPKEEMKDYSLVALTGPQRRLLKVLVEFVLTIRKIG